MAQSLGRPPGRRCGQGPLPRTSAVLLDLIHIGQWTSRHVFTSMVPGSSWLGTRMTPLDGYHEATHLSDSLALYLGIQSLLFGRVLSAIPWASLTLEWLPGRRTVHSGVLAFQLLPSGPLFEPNDKSNPTIKAGRKCHTRQQALKNPGQGDRHAAATPETSSSSEFGLLTSTLRVAG